MKGNIFKTYLIYTFLFLSFKIQLNLIVLVEAKIVTFAPEIFDSCFRQNFTRSKDKTLLVFFLLEKSIPSL